MSERKRDRVGGREEREGEGWREIERGRRAGDRESARERERERERVFERE